MKLIVLEGHLERPEFLLGATPVTLGRAPECSVVIDDEGVSREHCRVVAIEDGFLVADLNSANGTVVNGLRITQPTRLKDGDLLVVGHALFEIRDDVAARPAARAEARPPREVAPARVAPPGSASPTAAAIHDAAAFGQRLEHRLGTLAHQLAAAPTSRAPFASLRDVDQASATLEAQRILAVCRTVASIRHPQQLTEILSSEAPALHHTVSAALDLLTRLRGL